MKRSGDVRFLYLILLSIAVIGYSCKKSENDSTGGDRGYYMKFTLGDTRMEFTGNVEGTYSKPTSRQYNTSIAGIKVAFVADKNNMTILLATDDETQKGISYTSFASTSSGQQKAKLANLVYFDESGEAYFSWMEELIPTLPSGTTSKTIIKITDAGSDYIKGNFSGELYNENFTRKLIVKDGEFYSRRAG